MLACPSMLIGRGHGICPNGPGHRKQTQACPFLETRLTALRRTSPRSHQRLMIPRARARGAIDSTVLTAVAERDFWAPWGQAGPEPSGSTGGWWTPRLGSLTLSVLWMSFWWNLRAFFKRKIFLNAQNKKQRDHEGYHLDWNSYQQQKKFVKYLYKCFLTH